MFKFLKDKLKKAVQSFSRPEEEDLEQQPNVPQESGEQQHASEFKDVSLRDDQKEQEVFSEVLSEHTVSKEEPPHVKDTASDRQSTSHETVTLQEEADFAPQQAVSKKEARIGSSEKMDSQTDVEEQKTEERKKPDVSPTATKKTSAEDVDARDKGAQRKGIFGRLTQKLTTTTLTKKRFDELFDEVELILLESNVAIEVIEKLREDLKSVLVDQQVSRGALQNVVERTLRASLEEVLGLVNQFDVVEKSTEKQPFVICFVGINGSGKTTTIAKMAHLFLQHEKSVVLAAADTFRAAAIEQLELHAHKLGVKLIKHQYGSDPAAVAYDAIAHARAHHRDVVLIDTAGRLHTNVNLVDEMKKIVRVAKPDLTIFVGESITGNDCLLQAQQFNDAVGIDGIILTKADVDEKGGAAISLGFVLKKPILYLGMGQEYGDLEPFVPQRIIQSLGL